MSKEQKITGNIQPPKKDLEILKQNFPHCFDKNGDLDFEKLKKQLSKNEINFSKESYSMDWLGKSYARLLATDETTTLLKEDETFNQKEENKNSENLLIKGDNLEVLKHLSNAYYEKIKMIYIDPPYNTGSDGFVYADDRKFTIKELQELAGVSEERAKRILDFTQSKSNSHSAWLTFMYPRLYIAKQLLKDDGVIFISIDDNEVAQLKLLMDEIFGEENFVEDIIWDRKRGRDNSAKWFSKSHEYILVYSKNKSNFTTNNLPITKETEKSYKNQDNDVRGKYRILATWARGTQGGVKYEFINKEGKIFSERLWLFSRKNLEKMDNENRLIIYNDNIYRKHFLSEHKGRIPESIWNDVSNTANASDEIKELFNSIIFDTSKPTPLLKQTIQIGSKSSDIILDFFAGSGTTGDAVMQLNAEGTSTSSVTDSTSSIQCGNRKFILVQLPELIDQKSNKTAYDFVKNELKAETPTIFEITKERLIRASKKIQEELQENKNLFSEDNKNNQIDLGFKIFETMPIWEDYNFEAEELDAQQIQLFDESKLTKEDIKALLVTWKTYDGISLTETIQETDLKGYTAHYSSEKLYLMDKGFKTENLKALLEKIDSDKNFNPTTIIAFGYHFESKNLREISENIKSYANKKSIDIDFITRY